MRSLLVGFLALATVLAVATPVSAATLKVGKGKPYTTIQDAVDASSAGDRILIFKGVYEENVEFNRTIDRLQFIGRKGAVWDGGPRDGGNCLTGEGDNLLVQGLVFRNGFDHVRMTGEAITVRRCVFRANGADSVQIEGDDATVDRCRFRGTIESSVQIEGDGAVVKRNDFRNVQGADDDEERRGVIFVQGNGTLVMRNTLQNIRQNGINLRRAENGVKKAGDGAQVLNNRLMNVGDDGIQIGIQEEEDFDEVLVRGNTIVNGDDDGIEATGDGILIERNTIRLVADEGIDVFGDDVVIKNNIVNDTTDDEGIRAKGNSIEISGNRVANTDEEGIFLNGNDGKILRNTVRDVFDDDSIKLRNEEQEDERATGGLIEGNTILDGVDDGIELDANGAMVFRNTIRNCGTDCRSEGIDLEGDGNNVDRNTVIGQTGAGILIRGGNGNEVTRNTVRDGHQDGIRIDSGEETDVTDCTVTDCDGEGFDNNGDDTTATGNTFLRCRRDVANSGTVTNDATFASDNKFQTGDLSTEGVIGCPDN